MIITSNGYRITANQAGFLVQKPSAAAASGWAFHEFVYQLHVYANQIGITDVAAAYEAEVAA